MSQLAQTLYAPARPPVPVLPSTPYPALHPMQSILAATFFGTPLAGSIVMALNYRRLGRSVDATLAVLAGLVITTVILAIGFILPERVPTHGLGIAVFCITALIARKLQANLIDEHVSRGGAVFSAWRGFMIGVALLIALFGGFFAFMYASRPSLGTPLQIGANHHVYYSELATRDEAQKLGDHLKAVGYFTADNTADILLKRDARGLTVSFIADRAFAQSRQAAEFADEIAKSLTTLFGRPVTIQLLDAELTLLRERPADVS